MLRCVWRNVAQSPFSWGEADVGGLKDFCVNFPCCNPELCIPGFRRGVRLEETDCGKSARWGLGGRRSQRFHGGPERATTPEWRIEPRKAQSPMAFSATRRDDYLRQQSRTKGKS